jgi:hypothetical protein
MVTKGYRILATGVAAMLASAVWADTLIVTADPFMVANADTFSVGGSSGAEEANRAVITSAASAGNLYLYANVQPVAGSSIRACLRVNGIDSNACVTYNNSNWPNATGNSVVTVDVARGDLLTVHFTELGGTASLANVRATFTLGAAAIDPDVIFADGFEGPAFAPASIVTGAPFLFANADGYSIGGSNGSEERNRAAVPRNSTLQNLAVVPSQQPAAGSLIRTCARVNGADTALCVDYADTDWPNGKIAIGPGVAAAQGDLVSVRFREVNGTASGANVRATLDVTGAGTDGVVVTDEPFMLASADAYSIGSSNGDITLERNRVAAPRAAQISHLYIIPSQQPAAGSLIRVCLNVNGVDSVLCDDFGPNNWPVAVGNTASVSVSAGDLVTVHFRELNGVASGANVRASFLFQ